MKKEDIFIGVAQKTVEKGVEYWIGRSYRPNWKDAVKWHVYKIFLSFPRKNAMLVMGGRATAFLAENTKYFDVISMEKGAFTVEELRQNHIGLMPINYWYWKVLRAMEKKDEKKADKYLNDMAKVMKRMKAQAVVINDLFAAQQRCLMYAANLVNVPVVYYYHGSVIAGKVGGEKLGFEKKISEEFVSHFMFWSRYNMDLSIQLGISKPENSYVVGYPYYYDRRSELPEDKRSVLFIGIGLSRQSIGDDEQEMYSKVRRIYLFCRENNIDFTYRTHPKEYRNHKDELDKLIAIGMKCSDSTLREDLRNHYIVIGFCSSVLWEAPVYGDFVIQLSYECKSEIFKNMMYCYEFEDTYHVSSVEEANRTILQAANGEIEPKELNKYNLMYGNIAEITKEAMDKIKEDRHKSAK